MAYCPEVTCCLLPSSIVLCGGVSEPEITAEHRTISGYCWQLSDQTSICVDKVSLTKYNYDIYNKDNITSIDVRPKSIISEHFGLILTFCLGILKTLILGTVFIVLDAFIF